MPDPLDVYLYGVRAASLKYTAPQRYQLTYTDNWMANGFSTPLSLSLPATVRRHSGRVLTNFLDNLLPDNASVRTRWATEAKLSSSDPFNLLAAYGADVAGAIEFCRSGAGPISDGSLTRTTREQIGHRLKLIADDPSAWNDPRTAPGKFSLGGAQGKFALAFREGEWFEPSGSHPSTHIFKPGARGHQDSDLVETVVMNVAAGFGMNVADVRLAEYDGYRTMIIDRFDRARADDGTVIRIHQEDMCQALGTPGIRKFEVDNGPGYRDILRVLDRIPDRTVATQSKTEYARALFYSWFVLSTDSHAKNYSIQMTPEAINLAPLYDVSSYLPYVDGAGKRQLVANIDNTVLATRLVDGYSAGSMTAFEWRGLARDAGLKPDDLIEWGLALAEAAPQAFDVVVNELGRNLNIRSPVLTDLVERVALRSEVVLKTLRRG